MPVWENKPPPGSTSWSLDSSSVTQAWTAQAGGPSFGSTDYAAGTIATYSSAAAAATSLLGQQYHLFDNTKFLFGTDSDFSIKYDPTATTLSPNGRLIVDGAQTNTQSLYSERIEQKLSLFTGAGSADSGTYLTGNVGLTTVNVVSLPVNSGTVALTSDLTNLADLSKGTSQQFANAIGSATALFAPEIASSDKVYASSSLSSSAGAVGMKYDTTGYIFFEGPTPDNFETTILPVDPTADRVITIPDSTGTMILSSGGEFTSGHDVKFANGTLTLEGTDLNMAGAADIESIDSLTINATKTEGGTSVLTLSSSHTGNSGTAKITLNSDAIDGTLIKDEYNMASNSGDHLTTQQRIKGYADASPMYITEDFYWYHVPSGSGGQTTSTIAFRNEKTSEWDFMHTITLPVGGVVPGTTIAVDATTLPITHRGVTIPRACKLKAVQIRLRQDTAYASGGNLFEDKMMVWHYDVSANTLTCKAIRAKQQGSPGLATFAVKLEESGGDSSLSQVLEEGDCLIFAAMPTADPLGNVKWYGNITYQLERDVY
jgi:hypothetical protein